MTLGHYWPYASLLVCKKAPFLCAIAAKRVKKQQTEKSKNNMQKIRDPIMRLPLRRQRKNTSQDGRNSEEKNPEIQG